MMMSMKAFLEYVAISATSSAQTTYIQTICSYLVSQAHKEWIHKVRGTPLSRSQYHNSVSVCCPVCIIIALRRSYPSMFKPDAAHLT